MLSIPEIATQLVDKNISQLNDDTSRTIFMVGSKSVGKSTLIHSFLDKTDIPKETLVLEYSFGRKSSQKQGMEKTVCHVWEYGGRLDLLMNVLRSVPVCGKYFYCVMVDLSKIKSIWNTLEISINKMYETYEQSGKRPELIIIGGKYDLFKNYDSEIKKFICSTIRSVALLQNAHLLFYSSKEPQLMRRAKEMLYTIGFGNGIPSNKEKNTNFSKPLIIHKGSDNWESIGFPNSTFEQIKIRHLSRIPHESEVELLGVTPSLTQRGHAEPVLDVLADSKYEELRHLELHDISIDDYLSSLR